jgi:two-component system sensor histidine kinase MtrB
MGAISYFTTRHFLVGERENTSVTVAFSNAAQIRQDIAVYKRDKTATLRTTITHALSAADSGDRTSHSLLHFDGAWHSRTLRYTQDALPRSLRKLMRSGGAAAQTYLYTGTPQLAVGVRIRPIDAVYVEIFDMGDLAHTLRVLLLALFGAGIVTTVLGAVLGRWASGRSLRPLTGVSRVAATIAGGELGTRLAAAPGDPDLAALTRSFNRMVDQLQERIEREARFTSDVSHELRSPLTTLAASLEVLEHQALGMTPSGRRALELLGADVRRFQRMVGDLLEISRSDTGSADVSMEEVLPGELVRRAIAAAQRTLPDAGEPPPVWVDPALAGIRLSVDKRRFERVMINLIENAAHYGGGATAVRVERGPGMTGHDASVLISVDDAGPGVPEAERARVFERFYRGHAAFQRGAGTGTGLGLALVAEHVRLHHGKVWAGAADGGGARFTIELPAYLADVEDEQEAVRELQ